jgi:hypothetical protein
VNPALGALSRDLTPIAGNPREWLDIWDISIQGFELNQMSASCWPVFRGLRKRREGRNLLKTLPHVKIRLSHMHQEARVGADQVGYYRLSQLEFSFWRLASRNNKANVRL